jgi:predicted ATP-grasp superfamily ATP-dependent carboligase
MNILITGVGGPTPRSFAISLQKYGKLSGINLIATDSNPLAVGLYQKELFNKSYVVPLASHSDYWQVMEHIITENKIDLAVILPEAEVLVWSKRQQNGPLPCRALIPDLAVVEALIDKGKMTDVLNPLNIVPRSIVFKAEQQAVEAVFRQLASPFWVRSTSGTSGLGSLKISDKNTLLNWLKLNPGVQQYIASEFLPGRNLACKMLYHEGHLLRAACAERVNYIMAKVAPSGITGNTSFGRLLNEPELVALAQKALDKIFTVTGSRKHGFFTVDFKEDANGIPKVTEINIRHVAFTQCFAAAGANFAEDTIRLLINDSSFSKTYKMYEFEKDLIFLRDVDAEPVLMKETDLLRPPNPVVAGEGGLKQINT